MHKRMRLKLIDAFQNFKQLHISQKQYRCSKRQQCPRTRALLSALGSFWTWSPPVKVTWLSGVCVHSPSHPRTPSRYVRLELSSSKQIFSRICICLFLLSVLLKAKVTSCTNPLFLRVWTLRHKRWPLGNFWEVRRKRA